MSQDAAAAPLATLAARDRPGLKRRLVLGYGAQGLLLAARTLEQIVLVPFFLAAWGTELYRDWLVLFATAGFLPLLDLGMTFYFRNGVRIAWAQADQAAFERLLQIRRGLYAGLLLIVTPLVIAAGSSLIAHGGLELHALTPRAGSAVFALLAAVSLLNLVQYYFSAIYIARNDFDRGVLLQAGALVLQIGSIAAALACGAATLAVAALALAGMLIFGCASFALDQRRRYPDLSWRIALPTRRELREGAGTSLLFWVPWAGLAVQIHAPVLLLGQLASLPAAVVAFTVARTLTGLLRQLAQQLALASGVEMARQAAQTDLAALRGLAMTTGRVLAGLIGLLAGGLWVAAEPALRFWTHGQVAYDPWLIGALLATILVITPARVGYVALHHTNRPLSLAVAFVLHAVSGMLLSAALIPTWGAFGAAFGMGASEMLALGGLVSLRGLRVAGVPVAAFLLRTYGSTLAGLALAVAVATPLRALLSPDRLGLLLLFGVLWAAIVALPALFLLLRPDQRSWLADAASRLIRRQG